MRKSIISLYRTALLQHDLTNILLITVYILFFSAWFLATIFWQFDGVRKRSPLLRCLSSFHILPVWTFFAPNPGVTDTHVLYRDKRADDSVTDWIEVPVFGEREIYHWIWNPHKRKSKLVVDALSEIKVIKNAGDRENVNGEILQNQLKFSKGYLLLLNIATSLLFLLWGFQIQW